MTMKISVAAQKSIALVGTWHTLITCVIDTDLPLARKVGEVTIAPRGHRMTDRSLTHVCNRFSDSKVVIGDAC